VKRVGINFGDNDFGNTLRPFVQVLLDAYNWGSDTAKNLTKEKVVELFNESSWGLYLLFQHRHGWTVYEGTKDYLKIDINHVLTDKEVDEYFLQTWRHNGHFYWVDFETGKVFWV